MACRRYRSDLSAAGHGEHPAEPAPPDASPSPSPAVDPQAEAAPQHFSSGLKAQIAAQRQYAEQQQQAAHLHAHIDQIPNLSPAQRHWLHLNPHGLYRFDLLHAAHEEALGRRIPVDSGEYFRYLADKLNAYGHLPPQQPVQAPHPPAPPMPEPMPPPMPHMTHVDIERDDHDNEPEATRMSAMVSAPVSRGEASYAMSGELEPSVSSVKLSKAEREHAQAAGVSEEVYAQNKLKMLKLKKSNVIKD